jgi:hypothetical protein
MEVINVASSKFNFINAEYQPGLVGGHCIGVDPYYLKPIIKGLDIRDIILQSRNINEYVIGFIGEQIEKELKEYNDSMKARELKEDEELVPLTPEQFEEFVKNGFIVMPDGSPLISDKLKKSKKMKHIKLEDYTRLNGSIITEENKHYDGPRVSDYEYRYGKNYGIPAREKGK